MTTQTALEIENLLPATFTAPGLSEADSSNCEKFPDASAMNSSPLQRPK